MWTPLKLTTSLTTKMKTLNPREETTEMTTEEVAAVVANAVVEAATVGVMMTEEVVQDKLQVPEDHNNNSSNKTTMTRVFGKISTAIPLRRRATSLLIRWVKKSVRGSRKCSLNKKTGQR